MRYRFRLNFDANLYNNLTFHAQLATEPVNNQLSTNQDFTSLGAHPPFSISEIWIDYRPTKSLNFRPDASPMSSPTTRVFSSTTIFASTASTSGTLSLKTKRASC